MPEAPPAPATETAPGQVTTTFQPGGVIAQPGTAAPADDSWETSTGAGGRDQVLADLAESRRKARAAEKEAAELRAWKAEQEKASMTELEKAQTAAAEATARAEKAERDALIARVAMAKGLPPALAGRLQGATKAELEADADELLKLVPAGAGPVTPAPDLTQGSKQTPPVRGADMGLAEARRRFPDHFKDKQ